MSASPPPLSAKAATGGGRWNSVREQAEILASALPALLTDAERVASAITQGVHGRRRVGTGETFWQYRRYDTGDSASAIDWRRSARGHHLYVRENEWEAAQSVWIWRDGSPSMGYASAGESKRHRAGVLALALGILLIGGGERIAAPELPFPPQSGRLPLRRLAFHYMNADSQSDDNLPPPVQLPRNGQFVWLSDFLMPSDAVIEKLRAFASLGVKGHLLQVLDPAEEIFPFTGRVRFSTQESSAEMLVGRAERLRGAYHERLALHRDEIGRTARRLGWTFSAHHTDQPASAALLALYAAASRAGQSGGPL